MVFFTGLYIISVYDRESGSRVASIPVRSRDNDLGWNALQHDVRGGHLLGTTDAGHLFWTPRYSDALQGSVKGAVLVTDRVLEELSFENGRVTFVVETHVVGLFLLHRFIANARDSDAEKKNYIYNFRARLELPTDIQVFVACSCFTSKTGTRTRSSRDRSCRSSAFVILRQNE
jgi:hypothetical protein